MTYFPLTPRRAAMLIAAGIALTSAMPAHAAPHGCGPVSRLTVTGSGESRVAPDLAQIRLGVSSRGDSATDAMAQTNQQQSAVIEALRENGVEAGDIQTSGLNLNPVMDHGEGRAPQITGYQASNMVTVRVSQIDNLGAVLDAIVGAGANEINSISFHREDAAGAEDDARRAAVEDARHKAAILAQAAGLELGPVLVLRDAPASGAPQPMMMRAEAVGSAPIEAGQLSLNAEVELTYALNGEGACDRDLGAKSDPDAE